MRSHETNTAASRRSRPACEGLESRELLTSHSIGAPFPGRHTPAADVQQFVPVLYPPGTPQPTAAEVERESFVSKSAGPLRRRLPGRFNTQEITIHGYGKPTSSNLSKKAHFQYLIFEPSNPSNPVSGEINIVAGNVLASGANIILDTQGPVGTEVNGLPTHLYWTHDISSGTTFTGTGFTLPATSNFPSSYLNAQGAPANPPPGSPGGGPPTSVNNWNIGFGDVTFRYVPDPKPQAGTLASGTVYMVVRGLLNTSGAQSSIEKNFQ